ncbi:MAG TPA: sugar ABC transporter substrate-binding protein [Chthoniobacterales bacterium]
MTNVSRRTVLKLVGATAAATMAGWSSQDARASTTGTAVTLNCWDYWTAGGTKKSADEAYAAYMKANPQVTIKRRTIAFDQYKRTLLQAASAGQVPDVIAVDNSDVSSFAALGLLSDLTGRLAAWSGAGDILDNAWKTAVWQGKRWAVPDAVNCLVLWYNKKALRDAGTVVPTTWDELRSVAPKLTKKNQFALAVSAVQSEESTYQWLPWLWQAGGDVPTLDGEGGKAALQIWKDLIDRGHMSRGVVSWGQQDVMNQFANGQAAMMVNGPWQIPDLTATAPKGFEWGVAPLPKNEQEASVIGAEDLAIPARSSNPDAAFDLIKWLKQPAVAKQYVITGNQLPSSKTLVDDPYWADDVVRSVFVKELTVARPRAYGEHYLDISKAIQLAIQRALTGQASVADSLAQAARAIKPLLRS